MSPVWSDNDGVAVLKRLADSLSALAAAIPPRRDLQPAPDHPRADLPIQDLSAHIEFARIWTKQSAKVLARRHPRACPLCGRDERTTWFPTQDGYCYDVCERCGMVYIPEVVPLKVWDGYFATLPDARQSLRSQMESTLTPAAGELNRARFGRYFRLIGDQGLTLAGARLLDIGTATGGSLTIAAELGLDGQGIDGLEAAVQFCHDRRPELRIALGQAEELLPTAFGGHFDLITMWETLEHTIDPLGALRRARDALAPNGLLAISVPNARNIQCSMLREYCFYAYGGYQGVGHVNLFTPTTLRRALDQAGFDLVHLETEFGSDWRQVAYYLQHRFERIHCFRNLVRRGGFMDAPEPELAIVLNWLSPALTMIENALLAGPIAVAVARRRER